MKRNTAIVVASASLFLAACTAEPTRDRFDPQKGPEFKQVDANEVMRKQTQQARERMDALVKSLESKAEPVAVAEPVAPEYNPLEEVKINLVVESGELQYILKAFADQTKMNLLIHPNLLGSSYQVSVDFRDVSAAEVFTQLTRIADIHGYVDGNTLIVNPVQEEIFNLSFMESDVKNSFASGGDVLGGKGDSGSGGSGGSGSGSNNQIKGEFSMSGTNMPSSNPYDELDAMLEVMVGKASDMAPHSSVLNASTMEELGALSRLNSAIRADMPLYSLNRMTGTLFVRAKPSVMTAVKNMVNNYESILGGQILIDAQIVEVTLNDNFQFGVDWSSLRNNVATALSTSERVVSDVTSNFGNLTQEVAGRTFTISPPVVGGGPGNLFSAQKVGDDFSATVTMLQEYGDVSVLSNPTIRSKHGQPAIISVGTSTAYISDTRVVTNGAAGTAVTSQEVETAQVFDGLMVGVVPFIDHRGDISLSVHPVQSKVSPESLALVNAGGDTRVTLPVVSLKSMVTQLKVASGDTVVLGGLIDEDDGRTESGIPWISEIPGLGNLFKNRANTHRVRELVMLIKVTRI